jgi:hypothetical protein
MGEVLDEVGHASLGGKLICPAGAEGDLYKGAAVLAVGLGDAETAHAVPLEYLDTEVLE